VRKHDLEIEEICCANDRFVSKMTPKLRTESTGESMTLLGRIIEFRELLCLTKDEKLGFRGIKRQEIR